GRCPPGNDRAYGQPAPRAPHATAAPPRHDRLRGPATDGDRPRSGEPVLPPDRRGNTAPAVRHRSPMAPDPRAAPAPRRTPPPPMGDPAAARCLRRRAPRPRRTAGCGCANRAAPAGSPARAGLAHAGSAAARARRGTDRGRTRLKSATAPGVVATRTRWWSVRWAACDRLEGAPDPHDRNPTLIRSS